MAKVTYIDLLPEDAPAYYKNLQPGDRYVNSRIVKKTSLLSKAKKKDLKGRSLFGFLAETWRTYTIAKKALWKSAGGKSGLTNWQAFIKDSANRVRLDMTGYAVPDDLHQARVGQLHIESPATEIKIVQYHPPYYYISQKVVGKRGMREIVKITEALELPLEIKVNYKSNLTSQGAGSFAKLYARVHHLYQGTDLYTNLEIDIDLIAGWKTADATLTSVLGLAVNYDLYIHLFNMRGDLYVDIVEANHSSQNWCRDPFCKDINEVFTRAFYQVPQHWAPLIVPNGSEYESIYKDF